MRIRPREYNASRVAAAEAYARECGNRVAKESFSASARAARTAPNLESSPHLHRSLPGYSLTVIDFGDGIVEARACFTQTTTRVKAPKIEGVEAVADSQHRIDEKKAWRAQRAKRSLRWRCLALRPTHFLTFTKRGKFASLDDAHQTWRKFYALIRKFKADFRYVAVPEMHADQVSYHIHVAVDCRYDVSFLRKLWYRALGGSGDERGEETPGGINAKYLGRQKSAPYRVAGYMAKYLGKSFDGSTSARKAYWCSSGLKPKTVEKFFEPVGDCLLIRMRDRVAPMAPRAQWKVFEWSYVGLHGVVMRTMPNLSAAYFSQRETDDES